VLALNVDTNQVVSVDEDERCAATYAAIPTPNDDVFFMPPDWSAMPHFYADMHQPTRACVVRAGQTVFDESESGALDVSAMGGGLPSTGGVPDGGDGSTSPASTGSSTTAATQPTPCGGCGTTISRPACRAAHRHLPVWAGTLYYLNVGGENFIPFWEDGSAGTQTTMYRVLNDGGDPTAVFSFEGNWYGAARLR
jgi:hypothetical protein